MKLRPKFRLAFLLIGMVPLLVTVCIGYWRASGLLRAKAIGHLDAVASLKVAHIEGLLERDLERVRLVSSRTQMRLHLRDYLKGPTAELRGAIGRILRDAQASIDDFEKISIVTSGGEVVASTDAGLVGADWSADPSFIRCAGSTVARTELETGDAGQLKIVLCGPLVLDGMPIGLVVVDSNAGAIQSAVRSAEGMGATGETLLGRVGEGGDPELLMQPRLAGDGAGGSKVADRLMGALAGSDGVYEDLMDYRGEAVMAAVRHLGATGIGLVVKIDKAEALAPMRELQVVSAAVAVILLVTVMFASVAISRSITRPLAALAQVTTQVRGGDLSIRAAIETDDEVAELAMDFNRMADHLEEAHRDLEAKVASRTHELAVSRERFALAVSGTADGIWDWDLGKDDVFFSDRFKELLGLEPEEMEDRYEAWEVLLHPADKEPTLAAIRAHLADDEPYDVEYRLACADGSYRWFRARGRAVRDATGQAVRMAGSISDIEEYKRAVGALVQSNRDLEQFAYVASHDLKEPLRMVASYVQLLERRYAAQLDDTAREFIGFATEGALRMRQLIDDLLVYARVGTRGKEPEPASAEKAFEAAVSDLRIAIRESGAQITRAPLPVVMVDPTQLIQLLENLLNNAIKFRQPGRVPEIHVSAEEGQDGDWVFKVADNGIGIAAEYQGRIFEIFQRLHSREDYPGTGIGLAVCWKIVNRHGGRIWVESAPGEGSAFFFTLKAAADLGAAI